MSNTTDILDQYIEKIDNLVEVDYGDFKRKIGQYIISIEEALHNQRSPEVHKTLADLRRTILYKTDAEVESSRDIALEKLTYLKKVIH